MLFDDDVVTDGEAKTGPFSGGFRCEEWIEHLLLHVRRNTSAVVPNSDLHTITKAFRRRSKSWLIAIATGLRFAFRRRIEAIQDQVQQSPGDVLRKDVGLAGSRIKRSLDGDTEALLLCPCAVPGEIKAFLNEGIDVDDPVFTRAFTRVQQHVLDDGIRPLTVLHDFAEIATQRIGQFINLGARL